MTSKGTIVYIGNFELPDKNAAAHRVMANAKIFESLGFKVVLIGRSNSIKDTALLTSSKNIDIYNRSFPKTSTQLISHTFGNKETKNIIDKYGNVKLIILYNTPSYLTFNYKKYYSKKGVKVVADYTEWYGGTKINSFRKLVAKVDTEIRMRITANHLDGLIVVSNYLKNIYSKNKNVILLPPLVDFEDAKWSFSTIEEIKDQEKINLLFAGNSGEKDRLDILLELLSKTPKGKFHLKIMGLSKEDAMKIYGNKIGNLVDKLDNDIVFEGWCTQLEVIKNIHTSDLCIFIRKSTLQNNAGFPTKYVEATTCGVPTVTTEIGDMKYYIKDGFNGIFLKNEKDLVRIANTSKEEIKEMKKNINKEIFDYKSYVAETKKWFESMGIM